LLADAGARVIKVEPPQGDVSRRRGPFPGDLPHPDKSGLFHYHNAGKEGITLNLVHPTGRDLLRGLLKQAM
jgi:crotonobetainyl-CoA:carnitine CoA-transferase CaiB-like acyl-CoA transferase